MDGHWLTRAESIWKLWLAFIVVLVATVAAELFIDHEAYFGIEAVFGFHAWYGFGACAVLIVIAKLIGVFFKRPDSYYGGRRD